MRPLVDAFFDEATYTVTYVVTDPASKHCAIIDPVLDYDAAAGRTSYQSASQIINFVQAQALTVDWILETHIHADHLSAGHYLQEQLGGKKAIGCQVAQVQKLFKQTFDFETCFRADGSQFDHLFDDGDELHIGELEGYCMLTPGHTPACMSYVIGDAVFVGDTLFMPDYGTARTDFPGGDAAMLYQSIRKILSLPSDTRLFLCHDYKAPGRDEYAWETTVAEQRSHNIHINDDVSESAFVKFRTERDMKLNMPALILPSVQINVRAGDFPPPSDNGTRYIKIPLNSV
ncbi:MAG: MBL fold metallo-hydrolase [Pseudomonadota bacterium]